MTPEAAIHAWMNSFGIPAYPSTSVPEEESEEWAGFPYITYGLVVGSWGRGEVSIPVNVWYRTESEVLPNAKVREMAEELGIGGTVIPCEGGAIWLKKGSPWAQAMREEGDDLIKRRYINVDVEYLIP